MNNTTDHDTREEANRVKETTERLIKQEVLGCQSSLIRALLESSSIPEIDWDEVDNMQDPFGDDYFSMRECAQLIDDTPLAWTRAQLLEHVQEFGDETLKQAAHSASELDVLRDTVVDAIGMGKLPGLEEYQRAAYCAIWRPPLEWWLVTDWLAEKLIALYEPVLQTTYGTWWGRTISDQPLLADGIMQEIAIRVHMVYDRVSVFD